MGRLGPLEIVIILGVILLLFGAGRIADIGKGLGEGIRNFKKGIKDDAEPPKQLPKKEGEGSDEQKTT
jgi:sec-independent protein translocase protein TatA